MDLILVTSVFMQLAAGILAIIYMRKTPSIAWLFIAIALMLIGIRRLSGTVGLALPSSLIEISGSVITLSCVVFIHNIFKQYNENISQLKSLTDIDRVMLSSLSHKGILNAIIDKLNATLNTDAAAVLTISKNNSSDNHGYIFNAVTAYNLSKKFQLYLQTRSNGFVSSVIDTRKPLIISRIGNDEDEDFLKTLRAEGFYSYLAAPVVINGNKPMGVLTLYSRSPRSYSRREIEFIRAMNSQIALALDRTQLIERIHEMSFESVRALVEAIEIRDPYTRGHSIQVADLALMIGAAMGFNDKEMSLLEFAGLLHDVGKIAVPEAILKKNGKLTSEEWDIMHRHPVHSVKIIEPVNSLEPIQDWILYHHERWDGDGYPLGRKQSEIPLQSRILAVCDTYSAMIGDRPYRRGLSIDATKKELERVAGSQLDPRVVDVFLSLEFKETNKRSFDRIEKFRKHVETLSKTLNVPSQTQQRKPELQLRFL